jgi:hypothetical protein
MEKSMIKKFFESPANRAGFSAWMATIVTAIIQCVVTQAAPPVSDVLGFVIGLVAILQPDNTVSVTQLEKAMMDVHTAVASKTMASVGAVISDAEDIVASLGGAKRPG